MKKLLHTALFTLLIAMSSVSFAEYSQYDNGEVSEGEIAVDLVLARPLGLVGSAIGLAMQGVGLIFSVPGGNYGETGEILVEAPLNYTFNRPLGRFEQ